MHAALSSGVLGLKLYKDGEETETLLSRLQVFNLLLTLLLTLLLYSSIRMAEYGLTLLVYEALSY